eukprot:scaffold91643_cov35-Tisochrysis_lutea.AAC.4
MSVSTAGAPARIVDSMRRALSEWSSSSPKWLALISLLSLSSSSGSSEPHASGNTGSVIESSLSTYAQPFSETPPDSSVVGSLHTSPSQIGSGGAMPRFWKPRACKQSDAAGYGARRRVNAFADVRIVRNLEFEGSPAALLAYFRMSEAHSANFLSLPHCSRNRSMAERSASGGGSALTAACWGT